MPRKSNTKDINEKELKQIADKLIEQAAVNQTLANRINKIICKDQKHQ